MGKRKRGGKERKEGRKDKEGYFSAVCPQKMTGVIDLSASQSRDE